MKQSLLSLCVCALTIVFVGGCSTATAYKGNKQSAENLNRDIEAAKLNSDYKKVVILDQPPD